MEDVVVEEAMKVEADERRKRYMVALGEEVGLRMKPKGVRNAEQLERLIRTLETLRQRLGRRP